MDLATWTATRGDTMTRTKGGLSGRRDPTKWALVEEKNATGGVTKVYRRINDSQVDVPLVAAYSSSPGCIAPISSSPQSLNFTPAQSSCAWSRRALVPAKPLSTPPTPLTQPSSSRVPPPLHPRKSGSQLQHLTCRASTSSQTCDNRPDNRLLNAPVCSKTLPRIPSHNSHNRLQFNNCQRKTSFTVPNSHLSTKFSPSIVHNSPESDFRTPVDKNNNSENSNNNKSIDTLTHHHEFLASTHSSPQHHDVLAPFALLDHPRSHPRIDNPFECVYRVPELWHGFNASLRSLSFKIVDAYYEGVRFCYVTPTSYRVARQLTPTQYPEDTNDNQLRPVDWWHPFVRNTTGDWINLPQSLIAYLPRGLDCSTHVKFQRSGGHRKDNAGQVCCVDSLVWAAAIRHALALAAITQQAPDLRPFLEQPPPTFHEQFEKSKAVKHSLPSSKFTAFSAVKLPNDFYSSSSESTSSSVHGSTKETRDLNRKNHRIKNMEAQHALGYFGCYVPLPKNAMLYRDGNKRSTSRFGAHNTRSGQKTSTGTTPLGTPTAKLSFTGTAPMTPGSSADMIELENIYATMEKGAKVCRIFPGKQWDPSHQYLVLNRNTRQILLTKEDPQLRTPTKPLTLDLRHIKDVLSLDYRLREMRLTQDKLNADRDVREFPSDKILIISFGTGFNLKRWMLLFDVDSHVGIWKEGLYYLIHSTLNAPYPLVVQRWLRKQFHSISGDYVQKYIEQKVMLPFIKTRLQYKVTSEHLQALTQERMTFELFASAYRELVHVHSLFSDNFSWMCAAGEQNIVVSQFMVFQKNVQKIDLSESEATEFMREYVSAIDEMRVESEQLYLTVREFVDFLFSPMNSMFDPIHRNIVDSMDEPLHDYWIASSHNTYLTGDQFTSDSELEAYARALLMGCRCIELDVWDPKSDSPDVIITHGRTLTSKVLCKDVLQVIKEYAFITSELPVILSIEDNCSVPYQRTLANNLKSILGDLLLISPVNRNEKCLPSPNALRNRIIIKHKKLPSLDTQTPVVAQLSDEEQDMFSEPDHIKQGVLSMREGQRWVQRLVVLTTDKLCWSPEDLGAKRMDTESINGSAGGDNDEDNTGLLGRPEDMHMTEEWFHGSVARRDAEQLLMSHSHLGDGLFLVRGSSRLNGEFTVSFLRNGTVNNLRISSKLIKGEKKYYYNENIQKDTVYELISYYQHNPIRVVGKGEGQIRHFDVHLKTPCPQPTPHEGQPWYAGNITKDQADALLMSYPENGAFLFRKSGQDANVYVLSWWVDDEIKHMRLKREGRMFVIHNTFYETLNAIVEEFSVRELYHGVCLKFPVNQDTVNHYAVTARTNDVIDSNYMELNAEKSQVRSTMAYTAHESNHISFPANAIITVTQKHPTLWFGTYNGQSGWFPSVAVTDLELASTSQFDKSITLTECVIDNLRTSSSDGYVDPNKPIFTFVIRKADNHWKDSSDGTNEVRLACETAEEMHDWVNTLRETSSAAFDKAQSIKSKEKVMKIASELSDLVVYCQAVPFNPNNIPGLFFQMCSFAETKYKNLLQRGLVRFNHHQISRTYPKAQRVNSTNFDPTPFWNAGVQMVALNYQTSDRSMQLNQARFLANGRCGYVLKPKYMKQETFDPEHPEHVTGNCPITLTITVIAGRHLDRRLKDKVSGTSGIVSPVVEVEIIGLACDQYSLKTRTVTSDGLHPIWNETFEFRVEYPEMALIRFLVDDGDFVRTDPFIGQATYPLNCIRNGFRSVQLLNVSSEDSELASLLVYINKQDHATKSRSGSHTMAGDAPLPSVTNPKRTISKQRSTNSHKHSAPGALSAIRASEEDAFDSNSNSAAGIDSGSSGNDPHVRSPLRREFSKDSNASGSGKKKKIGSITKAMGKLFTSKKSSTFD